MFGWRKKQIAEQVSKDIGLLPETKPEVEESTFVPLDSTDAEYTIGINSAGHTQLRIRQDYGSTTLTMTPTAVHQLIRQLEATLDDSND